MNRHDLRYLSIAHTIASASYAVKRKVGAIIVKDTMIISDGYNGTPSGFPNVCEYAELGTEERHPKTPDEVKLLQAQGWKIATYPCVLHAESNAITKLARLGGNGAEGATLYCTDEPCLECAKLIVQSGIKRVVYEREYHTHLGLSLLEQAGVETERITLTPPF